VALDGSVRASSIATRLVEQKRHSGTSESVIRNSWAPGQFELAKLRGRSRPGNFPLPMLSDGRLDFGLHTSSCLPNSNLVSIESHLQLFPV
jgi:hypothetical protein